MMRELCLAALFILSIGSTLGLKNCEGLKIHVLDLQSLQPVTPGMEACSLDVVRTHPQDGVAYIDEALPYKNQSQAFSCGPGCLPHEFGAHSAPWYVVEAIKSSEYYTRDIQSADLVWIDDYCYYIWYLAWAHSYLGTGDNVATPGDSLLAGYEALLRTPHWRASGGAGYVLHHSHPGFMRGGAEPQLRNILCANFSHATHVVPEAAALSFCPSGAAPASQLILAPYVPNMIEHLIPSGSAADPPASSDMQLLAQGRTFSAPRAAERRLLLFSKATCSPSVDEDGSPHGGKKMRKDITTAIHHSRRHKQPPAADVDIQCAMDRRDHLPFANMSAAMGAARFCLALPGDSASSRRLSEIMAAGCIPVFAGPPFHTMPFTDFLDWRALAVIVNISQTSSWLHRDANWGALPTIGANEAPWSWLPDQDIGGAALTVARARELVRALRSISDLEIASKLAAVAAARSLFVYQPRLSTPPNAANGVVAAACRRTRASGRQRHRNSAAGLFTGLAAQVGAVLGGGAAGTRTAAAAAVGSTRARDAPGPGLHTGGVEWLALAPEPAPAAALLARASAAAPLVPALAGKAIAGAPAQAAGSLAASPTSQPGAWALAVSISNATAAWTTPATGSMPAAVGPAEDSAHGAAPAVSPMPASSLPNSSALGSTALAPDTGKADSPALTPAPDTERTTSMQNSGFDPA